MTSLTIKTLHASTELDQAAMTAVRGGAFDRGNSSVTGIAQGLVMDAPNIVVAGPGSSLTNSNNVSANQDASQYIRQSNGDVFSLLIGLRGGPIRFLFP